MKQLVIDKLTRRVQIHPALDAWMQGDRFGEIIGEVKQGRNRGALRIRLDKSGRTVSFTITTATQTNIISSKSNICEFL